MRLYRQFASQEEIDAQYDIVRSVDDPARYRERIRRLSERARRDLDAQLDVRFGPTLPEHLDVFRAGSGAPVVVFIHGGYWRSGTSKDFSLAALGPIARGVSVVVTNYALCPEVTIEEITRQSRAALAWVWEHAADFGADRERIYVVGHSAGGQQVAMLLSTDWEGGYGLPPDIIKGGLAISGVYDLRPLRYSFLQPALQLSLDMATRQSPLLAPPSDAPELVVSVGSEEPNEFLRQSRDFVAAWSAAGLPVRYDEQAGKNHWTVLEALSDSDSDLCQQLVALVGASA